MKTSGSEKQPPIFQNLLTSSSIPELSTMDSTQANGLKPVAQIVTVVDKHQLSLDVSDGINYLHLSSLSKKAHDVIQLNEYQCRAGLIKLLRLHIDSFTPCSQT